MHAQHAVENSPAPENRDAAYQFVCQLAADLSGKTIELPGYPEVALRVQKLLTEESVTSDRLVRVLGAEPTLSARVLTLANSAAHNPAGKPVADLRTAIIRLGFDPLRTAVIGFAMAQQREAAAFKSIQAPMRALWQHSVEVSALCFVLARLGERFNPDTALLAGIVSGVGKLYILTRASRHPQLFGDPASYGEIVRNWHANVAEALLDNWQMAEEIVRAVHDFETVDGEARRNANLADLLSAAHLIVAFKEAPDALQMKVSESPSLARLGLDANACENMLMESIHEVAALRVALGE